MVVTITQHLTFLPCLSVCAGGVGGRGGGGCGGRGGGTPSAWASVSLRHGHEVPGEHPQRHDLHAAELLRQQYYPGQGGAPAPPTPSSSPQPGPRTPPGGEAQVIPPSPGVPRPASGTLHPHSTSTLCPRPPLVLRRTNLLLQGSA